MSTQKVNQPVLVVRCCLKSSLPEEGCGVHQRRSIRSKSQKLEVLVDESEQLEFDFTSWCQPEWCLCI